MSAWPAWRAVSSSMWASTQRRSSGGKFGASAQRSSSDAAATAPLWFEVPERAYRGWDTDPKLLQMSRELLAHRITALREMARVGPEPHR